MMFHTQHTRAHTDVLCLCYLIPQWKGAVPKLLAHLSLWRQHSFTHSGHLDAIWVESAENHYPGWDIIHLSKWAVCWHTKVKWETTTAQYHHIRTWWVSDIAHSLPTRLDHRTTSFWAQECWDCGGHEWHHYLPYQRQCGHQRESFCKNGWVYRIAACWPG